MRKAAAPPHFRHIGFGSRLLKEADNHTKKRRLGIKPSRRAFYYIQKINNQCAEVIL